MEYEIELKLLTNEQAGDIIETKLLPLLNASVTQDTVVLSNHYFDTPDKTLRQHDIGLRIRGNKQTFEQTLKTAGKSLGGLHQRPEYNVSLDQSKNQSIKLPELKLFPCSAWPETINVDDLQTKIETLFTTHFERKIYLIELSQGDIVELVWDVGEITSGNKNVAICEIELELKKGSTTAIFNLAKHIVRLLPVSIGIDSKAARGYNLLNDLPAKKIAQYHPLMLKNMQTETKDFVDFLTTLLFDFQVYSAEIRRQYSDVLTTNISLILSDLVECMLNFNHHCPCLPLSRLHIELKALLNDWSLITSKVDKKAASVLLTRAHTTQIQLDITQCLVEQPWSPVGNI